MFPVQPPRVSLAGEQPSLEAGDRRREAMFRQQSAGVVDRVRFEIRLQLAEPDFNIGAGGGAYSSRSVSKLALERRYLAERRSHDLVTRSLRKFRDH